MCNERVLCLYVFSLYTHAFTHHVTKDMDVLFGCVYSGMVSNGIMGAGFAMMTNIEMYFFVCLSRETNLKFKMGLKVTDERLQEENQLAKFNGRLNCAL